MTGTDKTIPELTEVEKARWDVAKSTVRAISSEVVQGTITEESLEAGFNQLGQLHLDIPRIINSLQVPADAGEYTDAITRLLPRIPDGWGRWISCGAGWYPIITVLDAALAELDPDYEVQQVKEKYGTLRYYCDPAPMRDPECDVRFDAVHPRPVSREDPAWQEWLDLWNAHCESPEHDQGFAAVHDPWIAHRDELWPKFDELVSEAEKRSAVTCERCGQSGSIRARHGWVKTLCDNCADQGSWSS